MNNYLDTQLALTGATARYNVEKAKLDKTDAKVVSINEDGSLNLNPNSLTILKDCYVEPALADAKAYDSFQFVRQGYFCVDAKDSKEDALVFNRIVSLKSSYKLPAQTK